MKYFKNKVALITGGTSGIGRSMGEAMCRQGSTVYFAGRRLERAQQTVSTLTREGFRAHAAKLDVTDYTAFRELIEAIVKEHGRLDIMVNNAGISIGGDARDITVDHWRKVLNVNVMGVLYGTELAYQIMCRRGSGQIVNIASLAGLVEYPGNAPYATSKFAVVGMSKTLRAEGAKLGVKVNVVCPGYIRTEIFEASEMVNMKDIDPEQVMPFKMMQVSDAARRIMRGMRTNEAVMVFPGYARMLVFLDRYLPAVAHRVSQKIIKGLRKRRKDSIAL